MAGSYTIYLTTEEEEVIMEAVEFWNLKVGRLDIVAKLKAVINHLPMIIDNEKQHLDRF